MRHHWIHFARRIVLALLLALMVGWLLGHPLLVLALGGYLIWTLVQTFRLHDWLYHGVITDPPESRGLWGELFDSIYRLQLQQLRSREKLQALVDRVQQSANSLRDGVIMTDNHGALDWWNDAAGKMLGFRWPTDRGVLIHNLLRAPEFKHYFTSKHYSDPLQLVSPQDHNLKLLLQINLFGDDERLIVVQDVSRLARLEEMRKDFVSNVSHELRTPLTVITGYLETMVDNADDLNPRWKKALLQMQGQANRMEALINDLLLLSKIENQGRHFKHVPVDVVTLLKAIRDDARALSAGKDQRLELEIETTVELLGDEHQLRSAFSNIVFNAVKYTPPGGMIRLRWQDDERGLHFSVKDTGVGIDPIHIPRLTERFYRADPSRHSGSGGTGLGLAIVKHVLLNHEGTLEVHSSPGQGSEFICHFPQTLAFRAQERGEAEF